MSASTAQSVSKSKALLSNTQIPRQRYDQGSSIHRLFEEQVNLTPHNIALIDGEVKYTYQQLSQETNRLAFFLHKQGTIQGTFVACYLQKSHNVIVAMLATLKAGGAYLLLDALSPPYRLALMLNDAEPALILTDNAFPEDIKVNCPIVKMDSALANVSSEDFVTLPTVTPDDLAYISYTSGSTGEPKGALITHRSVVNHASAFSSLFNLDGDDRVPLMAPLTFDVATEEILPPLLSGCVLIASQANQVDMAELTTEIDEQGYTILNLPAPMWHLWVEFLTENHNSLPSKLRTVIVGSDRISTEHFHQWQQLPGAARIRWVAAYGTTETTVTSSFYFTANNDDLTNEPAMPIGLPIAHTSFYILDEHRKPVACGEIGELYIGGISLARGYHRRPELTAQRFMPDPFSSAPQARMYRTGDLVRQRPDGVVVCLGREDQQVKINGYRVELGEVEAALLAHPSIHEAAVTAVTTTTGETKLIAFVVAPDALRGLEMFLDTRLQPHMLPAAYLALDVMPLTTNGKLDRQKLATIAKTYR